MDKLTTTRSDTGVFDSIEIFDTTSTTRHFSSVRLQFAKFSHGYSISDFKTFIESLGVEHVVGIGRLSFPNEWQVTLNSQVVREKLIRSGRIRINNRSCWIFPMSISEIRGYIHWLPNEIPDFEVREILKNFGEVLFIETLDHSKFNYKIASDTRYFALYLKLGASKEDLPHFITISRRRALITVRGRKPACFHCLEIGHRKSECKTYRETLGEYCMRPSGTSCRRGKRGLRHKPDVAQEAEHSELSASGLNSSANEVQTSMPNVNKAGIESTTDQETSANKKKKKARRKKKKVNAENTSTAVEAAVEVAEDVQSKKNDDLAPDNSKTSTQVTSTSSSKSALPTSLNLSSTVEHFTNLNEEGDNLNLNIDNTNVPSVLESENPSVKEEKVDLVCEQMKALFIENTIQNQCDNFEQPKDDYVVSSRNQSLEFVDEKSTSVSICEIIAQKSNEGLPLENCSNKNSKNICKDLAKKVNDSSADSVRNNTQQVSEEMKAHINSLISDIINNFILQITAVLAEASVVNITEIKNKLLGIHDALLCAKNSDNEAKCNLIQHDKNSNIIDSSDTPKESKKKKKKSKKIHE